jgi:glycosyltransferase involved in cell wall biosynthesis
VAGTKDGVSVLIRALSRASVDIPVDVFGAVSEEEIELATRLKVMNQLMFHGEKDHSAVVSAIESADIGFCLLGNRLDWRYAYPIRIGEYLAGGTVPLASGFPGIRHLTRDASVLVKYDPDALAEAIESITNDSWRRRLQSRARERAEEVSWNSERKWFAKQVMQCDLS